MLPARIFCGSSAASIQQTMDQHLSPNTVALVLTCRNKRAYSEWLGVRLFIAWYQCRLNPHQWQSIATRYSALLQHLHLADGLSPVANFSQTLNPHDSKRVDAFKMARHPSANSPWSVGLPWENDAWREATQAPSLLRMLNHTWSVAQSTYAQVADLLLELMAMQSLVILIPNLASIDVPSREVLLHIIRAGHGQRGEVMLGLLRRGDQISTSWLQRVGTGLSARQKEALFGWLFSLDLNADYIVQSVSEIANSRRPNRSRSSVAQREARQRDAWAERMLSELEFRGVESPEVQLQSMWSWYQVHAYQQVFDLAQQVDRNLLARVNPGANSLFYSLLSLVCYQLGVQENELFRWLSLVTEYAELALQHLPPGPLQTHLLLTLAQISLLYPEEFQEDPTNFACTALEHCERAAVSAARQLGPKGAYQRVWAALLQIRALHQWSHPNGTYKNPLRELPLHLRQAQLKARVSAACQRDWVLTLAVVRTTFAELGLEESIPTWPEAFSQDELCIEFGQETECTYERSSAAPASFHQYHALCYEAEYWTQRYSQQLNVSAAQAWSQALRQYGQVLGSAYYADTGTLKLAVSNYQLGALNGANREFAEWRSRQDKWRSQVMQSQRTLPYEAPWLSMVMAAWRVGSVHTAQAILQHRLQLAGANEAGEQAVCQAVKSLLMASQGETVAAKQAFQAAIRSANQAFNVHIFSRITLIMGLAYESLQAQHSACALYRNLLKHALDLAHTRAADIFPIMIRLMRLQDYNRDYVAYSMRNVKLIMSEPENWWYLGDLLELMRQNEGMANFAVFNHEQLVDLTWCASQRLDCEAVTRQFCQRLPLVEQERLITSLEQRHKALRDELPVLIQEQNQAQLFRRHAKFLHHCQAITRLDLPVQLAP